MEIEPADSRTADIPLLADQLLSVNQRVRKGTVVLTVVGKLDAATAPLLRAALDQTLVRAGSRHVVVDVRGVSVLAPAGLAALTQAGQRAVQQGGHHRSLRVVVDDNWRERLCPFPIGEVDQVLTLYRSLRAALVH